MNAQSSYGTYKLITTLDSNTHKKNSLSLVIITRAQKKSPMEQHDYLREIESKASNDPRHNIYFPSTNNKKIVYVSGPVIIGAGPSGLAVAACLREKGVPSLILERCNCIASLWQLKTYDRLSLHLPKQFCELPLMPFPETFPTYPTKQQFVEYLEEYACKFNIEPSFEETVVGAEFDEGTRFWRVRSKKGGEEKEYVSKWIVAATGENAEEVVPEIEGMMEEEGVEVVHTCRYKNGGVFEGKRVLVVGCGNSGMEVCLDLCNYGATPSLVVRDSVHILPREMLGKSTFGLSMWLLKWIPISLVDRFLLAVSQFTFGDTTRLGINRPCLGPLQLKNLSGKTPVLDIGTLAKIKSGDVKICPAIRRVKGQNVEFIDGREANFDVIILATGYKSNVPSWLKEEDMFSKKDGLPQRPFPNGWKGERGLYAVGFTKRGLLGASMDAKKIAEDIQICWENGVKYLLPLERNIFRRNHDLVLSPDKYMFDC